MRRINRAKKLFKLIMKTKDPEEARALLPKVYSALDKLAKHYTWHPNKVARYKAKVARYVASLTSASQS